jgi:hypothetical protein
MIPSNGLSLAMDLNFDTIFLLVSFPGTKVIDKVSRSNKKITAEIK